MRLWRKHPVWEGIEKRAAAEDRRWLGQLAFQQFGYAVLAATTPEEVHAARAAYEERKRTIGGDPSQ